jgi:tRNA/rRNA methyltransferase
MRQLKIIIVDPKYQMNAGYVARVAKNFGTKKLFFVNPRADLKGKKAIMFSKHGVDLLRTAKVYETFEKAILGCDIVLGTTGIWRKGERMNEREYTLDGAIEKLKADYPKDALVGLVIGRDDKGLNREELEKCDILLHIASDPNYSSLNISHALAILLYAFTRGDFSGYERISPEMPSVQELEVLMRTFDSMTKGKKIRNRTSVRNIFSKMVRRAHLNRGELHALITALK